MRVRRKNTIFRIYLAALLVSCVASMAFLVSAQNRYHRSRVLALEKRISEFEKRLAERSSESSSSLVSTDPEPRLSSFQQRVKGYHERPYYVEGSGNNRKYAYLDLRFHDGYRARYYFRPFPSRSELVRLQRRIEDDALLHFMPPDLEDDFDG